MPSKAEKNRKRKQRGKRHARETQLRRKLHHEHAEDDEIMKDEEDENIIICNSARVTIHNEVLRELKSYKIHYCIICSERKFQGDMNTKNECDDCKNYMQRHKNYPPWSDVLSPIAQVPDELRDLSTLERMMISLSSLECYVVKLGFQGTPALENEICPRGLRRNTIAFPMDLYTLEKTRNVLELPWSPASLIQEDKIRVILYKGSYNLSSEEKKKLQFTYKKELTVRRDVVLRALQWKIKHCELYQHVRVCEEVINALPDEEVYVDGVREENEDPENENLRDEDEDFSSAFMDVPIEREKNVKLWRQLGKALKFPISPKPLSEYISWKEYFYRAFPVLFPYCTELNAFDKVEDAVRHLLLHKEDRFRKDCRFYFVAFSQIRRRKIMKSSKIQCGNKRMNSVLQELQSITEEQWRVIGRELEAGKNFCDIDATVVTTLQSLTSVSASLRNTWGNKKRQRNELRSMICRFGRPVVWFTICPSQQYNPLVVQLGGDIVPKETIETLKDRMEFCMNDPVACTEFFHLTIRGVLKVLQVEIGMNQYYGVIEAQMRGTLHLHLLAWNTSHKLSSESDWIEFADKVCSATVTETPVTEEAIAKMLQQYPDEVKCEYDFIKNALILCKSTATNLHDYRHRKSCFKISGGKRTCKCRYKFPRDLVKLTSLKSDGLEMSRNHAYINCYNYLLMNLFRCNHDIRVLPNIMNDDLLALLFYLTNYTTKMENSNYSVCDVAATARRELFNELENPTARKYADRLFIRILNKITGKNEVSSNLVVNELLTYQEEYCSQKFKTLHYGILLRALSGEEFDVQLSIPKKSNASFPEEDVDDEHIVDTIVVSNLYDDYANRGDSLKFLSIYEYVSRVYKKKTDPETSISGHKFNIGHAQHGTHVQMLLAADSPYVKVPKLVGPSTMKFSDEEYVKLLILIFKPWTDINYVRSCMYENIADYMTTAAMDSDINVQLMENFMLLQKSRLAAEKKRLAKQNEQTVSAQSEDGELLRTGLNSEVDNEEEENDLENVDLENVELFEILDISRKQLSEAVTTNMTHTLRVFKDNVIDHLEVEDKSVSIDNADENEYKHNEVRIVELQKELAEDCLDPTYIEENLHVIIDRVADIHLLNAEQKLALSLAAKSLSSQELLILMGEAGTGKSKCLEAMNTLFRVIGKPSEIVSSGTTGVSSARLRCRTIHSLCGWRYKKPGDLENENSPGIVLLRKLLPRDLKLLLIDEVSMLDARMLFKIDHVFRLVFHQQREKMFGGVSICFSGDFFQLPPVGGHSLINDVQKKKIMDPISVETILGMTLWRSIENVVILQQNYRQEDPQYLNLLRNWKNGKMKGSDWQLLKSRCLHRLPPIQGIKENDIFCIVKFNETRHLLNEAITRIQGKDIIELLAKDTSKTIDLENSQPFLRALNDNRSKYFSGVIRIFEGAQVVLTHNYSPATGIAKGTRGYVVGYDNILDEILIRLPTPIRSEEESTKLGIRIDEYVVKRVNTSFQIEGHTIRRSQFGLDLGYAVTDFKSQGETVKCAFVDISVGGPRSYYSTYVMLSRVRTLNGLYLLNDFESVKINPVVPKNLEKEMRRLEALFVKTKSTFFATIKS